jgi:response regulator RpfG family c-di-GMP phosphodiesterase
MNLPKIKTLNHQVDVIEANSTSTEARLERMEKLLERIAEQLERAGKPTPIR